MNAAGYTPAAPERPRLLIVSCSRRKRADPGLLPAIERYDGPPYRVLRRFLRQQSSPPPDVYILSAEFGLIPHTQPIPSYDRLMTAQRARELQPIVCGELQRMLTARQYTELFLCMSHNYIRTLEGYDTLVSAGLNVQVAACCMGQQLSRLHDWLYEAPPAQPDVADAPIQQGKARIRGIDVELTPEQVFDVARRALAKNPRGAARYYAWYVMVDNQRVSPKWLVSQLTGLPAGAFVTDEARRVLARCRVKVERA
jgi:hypothetical protein